MRVKDTTKQQAVIDATIKIVNEIGFASASISKIAKEASVSVATIYIYHKDKEDLILNTYYHVKKHLLDALHDNFSDELSVKQNCQHLWDNTLLIGQRLPDMLAYSDQFANSPFYESVDKEALIEFMQPSSDLLRRGIAEGQLKELSYDVFLAFFVAPANFLGNRKLCANFELNDVNLAQTFDLAWKAISIDG